MHLSLRKLLRQLWSVLCGRVLWAFVKRFSRDLFAQLQRQAERRAAFCATARTEVGTLLAQSVRFKLFTCAFEI